MRHSPDHAPPRTTGDDHQDRTLDDPTQYGTPKIAIFTCDKQEFHTIPEGMPSFEKLPPQR